MSNVGEPSWSWISRNHIQARKLRNKISSLLVYVLYEMRNEAFSGRSRAKTGKKCTKCDARAKLLFCLLNLLFLWRSRCRPRCWILNSLPDCMALGGCNRKNFHRLTFRGRKFLLLGWQSTWYYNLTYLTERSRMTPHEFTFLVWQTKPRDLSLKRLALKSTVQRTAEIRGVPVSIVERLRFTFTASGKSHTQAENFSK